LKYTTQRQIIVSTKIIYLINMFVCKF